MQLLDVAFSIALIAAFVVWYDWDRMWVFQPPSMIHAAFNAGARRCCYGLGLPRTAVRRRAPLVGRIAAMPARLRCCLLLRPLCDSVTEVRGLTQPEHRTPCPNARTTAYRNRKPGALISRYRWWTKPFAVLVDPKKAGRVTNNPQVYADEISPVWAAFWGESTPFLMHGNAAHRGQRKLAAFLLTPEFAEEVRPHMRRVIERWASRFDDGEWKDIGMHAINALTWKIMMSLTVGDDAPDWRHVTLAEVQNARVGGMASSAMGTAVLPLLARATRWLKPEHKQWEAFIRERIADQRAGRRSLPILERLCAYRDGGGNADGTASGTGAPATDDEIFGVLLALHIGGHHGPASVISWAIFHLLRDRSLFDEVKKKLDDEAFMAALLVETARMYPGGVISRFYKARTDDASLGVRRGETVVVPWFSFHRDAAINSDPDTFDPSRKQVPGAFYPFGLGAHSCVGQRLMRPMFTEILRLLIGQLECRLDSPDFSFHSQLVTAEMDESMYGRTWARRPPAAGPAGM